MDARTGIDMTTQRGNRSQSTNIYNVSIWLGIRTIDRIYLGLGVQGRNLPSDSLAFVVIKCGSVFKLGIENDFETSTGRFLRSNHLHAGRILGHPTFDACPDLGVDPAWVNRDYIDPFHL